MTPVCIENVKRNLGTFTSSPGVSGTSDVLNELLSNWNEEIARSVTLGKHYSQTLDNLIAARDDSVIANTDGYSSKAFAPASYQKARQFLELLPMNVPVPDVYVDSDGEVRFEWYKGPRSVFAVTVGSNGELYYAGLFGASKSHGTEYLDDELPDAIINNIRRV